MHYNYLLQIMTDDTYLEILFKAGWILVPILFMSVAEIYIIIERWIVVAQYSKKNNTLTQVKKHLETGNISAALQFCESQKNPSARMLAAGLRSIGQPIQDIEQAMETEALRQTDELEHNMSYLGIISTVAPMLGFLGTIFGVIKIFYNISLIDNISIGGISSGLYQKMVSSAAGLWVGIVAYVGYQLLNGAISRITIRMERDGNELIGFLKTKK